MCSGYIELAQELESRLREREERKTPSIAIWSEQVGKSGTLFQPC